MMPRWAVGAAGLVVTLLVGLAFFALARPVRVLPRMALAPGFALVDQGGARLTSEDLRGAVVVYSFAPAGCGAPCEAVNAPLRALRDRVATLDAGGAPVRLVTVSLDPERDRPERLRAAAPALGADGETWRFATGDPRVVKQVVGGGFGVFYEPRPEGGVRFDPVVVLVDGWGMVRAEHRVGTLDPDAVAAQIELLGNEIRASTGVARYAYEAAHLFSCYAN